MKHRIIALLIAAISGIIVASAYDIKVDGIYYNIIDGEYLEVTSIEPYGEITGDLYDVAPMKVAAYASSSVRNDYSGDIVVPDSVSVEGFVKKLPVLAIGTGAFRYSEELVSVTLPGTIRTIGNGAFACSSIRRLDMSAATVEVIEDCMCYFCDDLTEVEMPKGVNIIGTNAFFLCGIREITLPDTVEYIEEQAFLKCQNLHTVNGGSRVISYSFYCFSETSLSTVIIPKVTEELSLYSFGDIATLQNVIYLKSDPDDIPSAYNAFLMSNPDCTLWVPDESVELYKNSERWTSFFTDIRPLSQSGIREVTAATGICEPARYFDLSGREVTVPQSGHIYIGSDGQKIRF